MRIQRKRQSFSPSALFTPPSPSHATSLLPGPVIISVILILLFIVSCAEGHKLEKKKPPPLEEISDATTTAATILPSLPYLLAVFCFALVAITLTAASVVAQNKVKPVSDSDPQTATTTSLLAPSSMTTKKLSTSLPAYPKRGFPLAVFETALPSQHSSNKKVNSPSLQTLPSSTCVIEQEFVVLSSSPSSPSESAIVGRATARVHGTTDVVMTSFLGFDGEFIGVVVNWAAWHEKNVSFRCVASFFPN